MCLARLRKATKTSGRIADLGKIFESRNPPPNTKQDCQPPGRYVRVFIKITTLMAAANLVSHPTYFTIYLSGCVYNTVEP
jgi:hypothetical protein